MRIVLALGGNAISKKNASTAEAQREALQIACKQVCALVKEGHEIVVSHGNGPQVGNLYLQQKACDSDRIPAMPMDTCVAMTQGSIGYWLQNALQEELSRNQLKKTVVSLITQVEVDEKDEAFRNPRKPVGPFFSEEEARAAMEREHHLYVEDSGRGWRRVMPSPKPLSIVEFPAIRRLISEDTIVVCGGGGGIPVVKSPLGYKGVEAVIDKDLAAGKVAEMIDADTLLLLTGVDYVYVDYNTPRQRELHEVTVAQIKRYMAEKQFAEGSMLPKIKAAVAFVEARPGKCAIITSIERLGEVGSGIGTKIVA